MQLKNPRQPLTKSTCNRMAFLTQFRSTRSQGESENVASRRRFLGQAGAGIIGSVALASLMGDRTAAATLDERGPLAPRSAHFPPRARNVIFLNMVGGPSQLDLFDYKPELVRWHGRRLDTAAIKDTPFTTPNEDGYFCHGPQWKFRQAGRNGAWLSELLPHHERALDHLTFIRSMHTNEFNHVPAQLLFSTGSPRAGRPTMGSWITYGLGSENSHLPGFIVMQSGRAGSCGAVCWGSGFMPGAYQGVPFRAAGEPVLHSANPPGISPSLRRRTLDTIRSFNESSYTRYGDPETLTRLDAFELAFRMQTSVPELTDVSREPAHVFELYGAEHGQNSFANHCLLARRLVERGVRFVQLDHGNWDHHGTGGDDSNLMRGLPERCRAVDQASSALVLDLAHRGLLKETLVIWAGEFGRHPAAQGKPSADHAGRDHQRTGYTIWLAGGGVKPGLLYGETDALGMRATTNPVHVHDLQATILRLLGLDHTQLTYRHQGRDFRLTDIHGRVVSDLIA
jgi:hypothetical protein